MDIEKRVSEMVADRLNVPLNEVIPSARFTDDLSADSLDTVELIMEFEKQFNIKIADEDAEKIKTVGDAIAYLQKNVK